MIIHRRLETSHPCVRLHSLPSSTHTYLNPQLHDHRTLAGQLRVIHAVLLELGEEQLDVLFHVTGTERLEGELKQLHDRASANKMIQNA